MNDQWNREGRSQPAPHSKYQKPRHSTSRDSPLLRIGKDITLTRGVVRWKATEALVDLIWKAAGEPAVLSLVLAKADQATGNNKGGRYVCIHMDDDDLRDRITSHSRDVLIQPAEWSQIWISPFVTDKVGLKKLYKQDRRALQLDEGVHEVAYENLRLLANVASMRSEYINRFMPNILPPEVLVVCVKKSHWNMQMPLSIEDRVARRNPEPPFLGLDVTEGYIGSSNSPRRLFFFSAATEHLRDPSGPMDSSIERRPIENASTYLDELVLSSRAGSNWPVFVVAIKSEWTDISRHMINSAIGMGACKIEDSCSSITKSVARALTVHRSNRAQDRRARSRSPSRGAGSSLRIPSPDSQPDVKAAAVGDVWFSFRLHPLVTLFIDEIHRAPRNLHGDAPRYQHITGCSDENVGKSQELFHAFIRLIKGPSVAQFLAGCTVINIPEEAPIPILEQADLDVKPVLDSDSDDEVVMLPAATSASTASFTQTPDTTKGANPYDDDDDDDW
ncbi:hypothetical protein BKA62DRAFT_683982 [Auriculariales sp. MPI-PUGE-AT-0066]|nr:hypothetical protein BKA62DRAFT_683982 [Auriculariales sp. MPI-PUGE-AT-0066]